MAQSVHVLTPDDDEYFPAAHATQSSAAMLPVLAKNVPAGQSWHVDITVAAIPAEYFPVGHLVQGADPVVDL